MRFYTRPHKFYGGIDLHARTMHVCILDHDANVVFDRNLACKPKAFLDAIADPPAPTAKLVAALKRHRHHFG